MLPTTFTSTGTYWMMLQSCDCLVIWWLQNPAIVALLRALPPFQLPHSLVGSLDLNLILQHTHKHHNQSSKD